VLLEVCPCVYLRAVRKAKVRISDIVYFGLCRISVNSEGCYVLFLCFPLFTWGMCRKVSVWFKFNFCQPTLSTFAEPLNKLTPVQRC
jgi:hypothetical protein